MKTDFFFWHEPGQRENHTIKEKCSVIFMGRISEKLELAPDILEGATVVNLYGKDMALVENYQSIIDYSPEQIKLQGKHVKLLIQGNHLKIDRFTLDDFKIYGDICLVEYIQT